MSEKTPLPVPGHFVAGADARAQAWIGDLPRLVEECRARWSLELGRPFEDPNVSLVFPATRANGTRVVLKVSYRDRETEHEADALALWDGDGAVRLLDYDRERHALLLERCEPGTQLWSLPEEEALRVFAGLLPRLWREPPSGHPFELLAESASSWGGYLEQRWERQGAPFERSLLDEALAALRELPSSQTEQVLVHQDFHGGNALLSQRGWLAIDPKPLVAERAFGVASILRDRSDALMCDPDAVGTIRRRLDFLVSELDLDRARVRAWSIAHALAWGVDETSIHPRLVAFARAVAQIPAA